MGVMATQPMPPWIRSPSTTRNLKQVKNGLCSAEVLKVKITVIHVKRGSIDLLWLADPSFSNHRN